jgi:hypothetical protein
MEDKGGYLAGITSIIFFIDRNHNLVTPNYKLITTSHRL